jgi:protein transport protein SEC61 subunit alpha
MALLMYLVASQVPLYGMKTQSSSDAYYIMRMILASQKGTLMELGISPIITSGMIMQLLIGAGIIDCKLDVKADRVLYNAAGKILVRARRGRSSRPRRRPSSPDTPSLPDLPRTRRAC